MFNAADSFYKAQTVVMDPIYMFTTAGNLGKLVALPINPRTRFQNETSYVL